MGEKVQSLMQFISGIHGFKNGKMAILYKVKSNVWRISFGTSHWWLDLAKNLLVRNFNLISFNLA